MSHALNSTTILAIPFLALTLASLAQGQESPPAAGAPLRIKLEQGEVLSANLIGATAEPVTVEVAGRILELKRGEVVGISQETRRFDSYGDIPFDDEKARLDSLGIELQSQPGATASIEVYGPRIKAKRRADRIKDYMVAVRGFDTGRINTMICARTKLSVEIWIVPVGGTTRKLCSTSQRAPVTPKKTGRRGGR